MFTVEDLLDNSNIHVAVFNGDLDLIVDLVGTNRWIENMNYNTKEQWTGERREVRHVDSYSAVAGFVQRYDRFSLHTILRSGHMVM